jgi:hypothetical protein
MENWRPIDIKRRLLFFAPQVSVTSPTEPDVFVSYAADDSEVVLPIVDRLERDGVAIWVDRRRITAEWRGRGKSPACGT